MKQLFWEISQIILFWSKTKYKAIIGARCNAPSTQLPLLKSLPFVLFLTIKTMICWICQSSHSSNGQSYQNQSFSLNNKNSLFSYACARQYIRTVPIFKIYVIMLKTISCILKFFATSYGKCPCDNKGGTVKRLVATASFQSNPY